MSARLHEAAALAARDELPPAASADRTARFRAMYAGGFGPVCRTLRRLGVPERDLEDVAHDVFVIVFRRLDDYDPARPAAPWLFGISYRAASDYRRRARNRREVVGDVPERAADAGPAEAAELRRQRAVVARALEALPLAQRAVFVAHELDGLTAPEIAEALAIPVNTVYSRLRLARGRFKTAAAVAAREVDP